VSAPGVAPPRAGRRRRIVLVVFGLGALLLLVLAGSFLARPFWWFERLGKAALRSAGLGRTTIAGPRGPIAVWRGGQGPTLLLLHGSNDQAGGFARVAGPLAKRHRLVVPDLPGHGESAPVDGPLSVADLVAGVEAVAAAEPQGARLTLVGNSLGGYLALVYALRHPERVEQVVLVNGGAIRAAPGVEISLLPKTRDEARAALDALTAPETPRAAGFVLDDLVRRAPGSPLARMLAAPVDASLVLDDRLGEIRVPVTLIWGEADRYMPVSYAEAVESRLPAARLETLAGCGHVPQRECPERLLEALARAFAAPPKATAE
jgi:pimeloyl-ACP methyl ester carboxylesterase